MELRFWRDPETGLPHTYSHGETPMKKQELPRGWTEKQIRELSAYHDGLTQERQAAEIQGAVDQDGQTLMVVPTKLVPEILKLITKKRTA